LTSSTSNAVGSNCAGLSSPKRSVIDAVTDGRQLEQTSALDAVVRECDRPGRALRAAA